MTARRIVWLINPKDFHDTWLTSEREAVMAWLTANRINADRISIRSEIYIEETDDGPEIVAWENVHDEQGREVLCKGCQCCSERFERRVPLIVHPPELGGREHVYRTFDSPDGWRVFREDPTPYHGRARLLQLKAKPAAGSEADRG